MRNKLQILFASIAMAVGLLTPLAVPSLAFAESSSKAAACDALNTLDASQSCATPGGSSAAESSVNKLIQTVVNILSIVVGVVAVIMLIVSGFRFITGGSDTNSVAAARRTLIYALVGLVIVALAQFMVRAVLTTATK